MVIVFTMAIPDNGLYYVAIPYDGTKNNVGYTCRTLC